MSVPFQQQDKTHLFLEENMTYKHWYLPSMFLLEVIELSIRKTKPLFRYVPLDVLLKGFWLSENWR